MSDDVRDWANARCQNSVRVNGCPDEGPYYEVPWVNGPFFDLVTETWCQACVEEDPQLEIDGDDVVWDTSENDNTELDEIRGLEIVAAGQPCSPEDLE